MTGCMKCDIGGLFDKMSFAEKKKIIEFAEFTIKARGFKKTRGGN